jgi:RNase P subunit RPR2
MKRKTARTVLTLASSAMLAGGAVGAGDAGAVASTNTPQATLNAATLSTLNKAGIRKMLATVEKAKAPEAKMGAMCYDMAMPPETLSYVCPTCGEKTLYTKDLAWKWNFELDSCRRVFKTLPKHETMTLDESGFCKKCCPGTNTPALNLQIRFDNGTTNTVSDINGNDLRMLGGFLSGKLDYPTFNDGTEALKNKLPRLHQLLGIKDP